VCSSDLLTSPQLLPAVIAKHDIGLALEAKSPPSRNLTITNKILQYLNAGLAIVASNTAGHREVLQEKPQAGIFIDPDKTTQCVSILENLLACPQSLAAMQRSARELAEQKYCWEKEAPALLTLVERALAG
jgi:glycosyltransferase involved in cell wall biosynthesis